MKERERIAKIDLVLEADAEENEDEAYWQDRNEEFWIRCETCWFVDI